MAPPISRRSKQNSTTSFPPPIPLPGIALGLFAAIAAGFAASRALRRKRPAHSLQDEQQPISVGNPPFKETEIEIKERDDSPIVINANGTITIAQEPSKLAAGSLKPVFDALEEVSFMQKRDATASEEGKGEDEAKKGEEEGCGDGQIDEAKNGGEFEENEKKGETMEKGKTNEVEGETAEVIVKIEASLAVDDASVEALQSLILDGNEKEAGEDELAEAGRKGTEVEDNGVIVDDVVDDEDMCNDDERSSAGQQPSPVLINGKVLDFFEEILDFKDEPDLLSSGSNSLSDAVSESSMQEVSSAPVKPFVPTEEILEASWPGAKPVFLADLNQSGQEIGLQEDENWSCKESHFCSSGGGSPEMTRKVPEFVENLLKAGSGQSSSGLKQDWPIPNDDTLHSKAPQEDVHVGLLNLQPVLVDIKEKEASFDKVNEIKFDLLSDVMDVKGNSIAFEGKVSIKVNGLDEGIAESTTINAKLLSTGSSLPKELDDCESVGECEHAAQSPREVADDFTGLRYKGEKIVEPTLINGKVLLEESSNNLEAMITDETSLQTGLEGSDSTKSDIHSNPELPAASELLGSKTCAGSENDLYDGESAEEKACLECVTSKDRVIIEGNLEVPKLQPAPQNLHNVDGTTAENNVKLEQEQSSLLIASKGITEGTEIGDEGITEGTELGDEGITNSTNIREDMDDGLSGEISVKDRIYKKEQEIEVTTRTCDANGRVCEKKELKYLTDSTHVTHTSTREADDLLFKGAVHQHGLQLKGVSLSKALEYLPLEIGFICLLIALISYVLWYLEVLPSYDHEHLK